MNLKEYNIDNKNLTIDKILRKLNLFLLNLGIIFFGIYLSIIPIIFLSKTVVYSFFIIVTLLLLLFLIATKINKSFFLLKYYFFKKIEKYIFSLLFIFLIYSMAISEYNLTDIIISIISGIFVFIASISIFLIIGRLIYNIRSELFSFSKKKLIYTFVGILFWIIFIFTINSFSSNSYCTCPAVVCDYSSSKSFFEKSFDKYSFFDHCTCCGTFNFTDLIFEYFNLIIVPFLFFYIFFSRREYKFNNLKSY
jgi:hypothetical protein